MARPKPQSTTIIAAAIAGVATIIAASIGAVALILANHGDRISATSATRPAITNSSLVVTTIAHTWSPKQKRFLGVYVFPSVASGTGRRIGPEEGQRVSLICRLTGRNYVDDDYESGQAASSIWLRLDNSFYVSALYIALRSDQITALKPCP